MTNVKKTVYKNLVLAEIEWFLTVEGWFPAT